MTKRNYNIQKDSAMPLRSVDALPVSAFKVRVHEAIQSGKLSSQEKNILFYEVTGSNQSNSFDDLPPETQQLILKTEVRSPHNA